MIGRERRLIWTAFVIACAAHATLVWWMSRAIAPPPPVAAVAPRVGSSPLIVPIAPPLPSVGEERGKGESIASVELPTHAVSPRPREIEQAFTRQEPPESKPPTPAPQPASPPLGPMVALPRLAAPPAEELPPEPSRPRQSPVGLLKPAPADQPEAERATPPESSHAPEPPEPAAVPAAARAAAKNDEPPAPQGPSDLDAFARSEGVDFRPGGIEARTGRPVKLVRPRIDLAFRADATAMSGRRVRILLQIETDATGAPSKVDVLQSSGSRVIDDAVRLAMFSSHFGGKMPDSFPFGIQLWD